jgi:hypothetical protein
MNTNFRARLIILLALFLAVLPVWGGCVAVAGANNSAYQDGYDLMTKDPGMAAFIHATITFGSGSPKGACQDFLNGLGADPQFWVSKASIEFDPANDVKHGNDFVNGCVDGFHHNGY